jgi:lipoprotein-releasing system permease protein
MLGKIIWRYLLSGSFSTKLITFISLFGVFIATLSLTLTVGIMNGFENTVKEKILQNLPNLVVYTDNLQQSEEVINFLKNHYGKEIKLTFWVAQYNLILQKGRKLSQATVYAGNLKDLQKFLSLKENLIEGSISKNGILVGLKLADQLGIFDVPTAITLIDPIAIKTPIGFLPKIKHSQVVGIYSTHFTVYDQAAIVDWETFNRFFKNPTFSVVVQLKNPYEVKKIASALNREFPSLYTLTWIDSNKEFFGALKLEKLGMALVVGLIVVVATFNITSLLLMKVQEKRKDIAIFRSFGIGRGFIFKLFLLQGLVIGLIGASAGLSVAMLLAFVSNKYHLIKVPADVYLTPYMPIEPSAIDCISIFGFVILLSTLAAYIPAYRASKEKIVNILRNE